MAKQKKTVESVSEGLIADQILSDRVQVRVVDPDPNDGVPTSAETTQVVMFMDPAMITVTGNTRLKLKQEGVDTLAEDIRSLGKVLEPVGVEEMAAGGFELIYGKYRHAAVTKLNADGLDIQLPVIVYANLDPVDRLRMQVSENVKRESLSLVDKALAMKALLDKGLSKVEVRHIFASAGGRKGNAVQDMSNVYLNDHLAILTFSKSLQDKIDDGIIPISSVKKLLKLEPSQREAVVKSIEVSRAAELEKEENEEDKFIRRANAEMEAEEAEKEEIKRLADAKVAIQELIVAGKEFDKNIKTVSLKHDLKFDSAQAAAWQKEIKEATDLKIANEKSYKKATKTYAALKMKADRAKEPKAAVAKPVKTSIGPVEMQKAIVEVTGAALSTKLKMSELESELKEMRKIGADSPAFIKILDAFSKLITGELTPKEAASDIADVIDVVLSKPISRRKK